MGRGGPSHEATWSQEEWVQVTEGHTRALPGLPTISLLRAKPDSRDTPSQPAGWRQGSWKETGPLLPQNSHPEAKSQRDGGRAEKRDEGPALDRSYRVCYCCQTTLEPNTGPRETPSDPGPL